MCRVLIEINDKNENKHAKMIFILFIPRKTQLAFTDRQIERQKKENVQYIKNWNTKNTSVVKFHSFIVV